MGNYGTWNVEQDGILRSMLNAGSSLMDIAVRLGKTQNAVYLYCYRHFIPVRKQLLNPMMRRLLEIRFGKPEYFRPDKEFYDKVGIGQKRWQAISIGYEQPTEDELRRVAIALNFSVNETFELMETHQLDLFDKL